MAERRGRVFFGVLNLLVAALVGWAVARALPLRWWPVDVGGAIVALALGASGLALLLKHRWAEVVTGAASFLVLALGMALFTMLVMTAGWLGGVYGPVGKAGATVFGLVAILALPYLVVLPAVELAWVGLRARNRDA